MNHIALTVHNLPRAKAFYQSVFNMRTFGPDKSDRGVVPMVSKGMLDQITLVEAGQEGELGRGTGTPGEQGGIEHFGFQLAAGISLNKIKQKIENAGGTYLSSADIAKGVPSMFFKDPEGYVFQVTRYPRFVGIYIAWIFIKGFFLGKNA